MHFNLVGNAITNNKHNLENVTYIAGLGLPYTTSHKWTANKITPKLAVQRQCQKMLPE